MGCGTSRDRENYLLETMIDHEDSINCIAISEDTSLLATGSEDKTIRLWSTKTDDTECLGILKGHTSYITSLSICETFVVSGSADTTIRKWDMTSCECLFVFEGHKARISRVICTSDFIFSTSFDHTAKAWVFDADEYEDGELEDPCLMTFKGHSKGVYPMIFIPAEGEPNPDNDFNINPGDLLITGSADCTAKSWDFESGVNLKTFKGHKSSVTCMCTDPEGEILYTGSADRTIRAWDINSASCLKVMNGHTGPVITLLVVNRLLYSGSQDGTARCWVREFGDCTRIYKGHGHSVVCLKFSDGILFTGCGDTVVRAFDAKSGALKRLFQGHEAAITCLSIVGDKMFTGSTDRTLRVWNIKAVKEDPDQDTEEGSEFNDNKQHQRLEDLDRRLDGYIGDDVDQNSVPAEAC